MKESMSVNEAEGAKWHLIQTLAGDQTDGYGGVPGIGVKRAVSLFEEKGYSWKTVREALMTKIFQKKSHSKTPDLQEFSNALTTMSQNQQPILWTPTADYQVDDGTGVQDASD